MSVFREGDEVVVMQGGCAGARGVFLALEDDTNWAAIAEWDGHVRRYPVAWLMPPLLQAPKAWQGERLATKACRHGARRGRHPSHSNSSSLIRAVP